MSGYHELTKKLEIGRNNVVVRSYQKQSVHLVYVIHLPDLHITDYGQIKPYGSGIHRGAPLEVFFNGKPLTIAQWPNEGFINIVSVLDGQNGKRFQYNSNVPRNWSHEDDPWVYGYWYWSWSDRGIKVNSLNAQAMTVTLAEPALYGLRTGGVSVFLSGDSRNNKITQCYLHDVDGGFYVTGGDRNTLETSGNIISNNDIFRYSRIGASGTDAIRVQGVGHLVQHNHVRNGQYTGIKFYGNDIIMEYNKIEYVCINTSDCGAFMTGMDWTTNDVNVNIGGGRDNIVVNNVLYNAHSYNLEVGNRGVTHAFDNELFQRLHAVPYKSSVWALRYPELASIDSHNPSLPEDLNHVTLSRGSNTCTTKPPSRSDPVPAWLPDGSRQNNIFHIGSKEGCWLKVDYCTNHSTTPVVYRDYYGETHEHAGESEEKCFRRAAITWKYCGSNKNAQVAAIYAPTGATTIAGDGCFAAYYGCPNHGGPADGRKLSTGTLDRQEWVEQHANGAHNESACLAYALKQWVYCGSSRNHPWTFIYRPTGAYVTAGAGCWIHVQKCPSNSEYKSMFYDAWGATNYNTDDDESMCLHQSEYYWTLCGSDQRYPVTAYYRPTTARKTYP
ncbi:hypothetical protein ACF0H5_017459 [Mactra antiquata]